MNIVLSSDLEIINFDVYKSILKVFVYAGNNCIVWDRKQKSCFDLWDEIKPNIFFAKNITEKEKSLCEEYNTKYVPTLDIVAADVFSYGKVNKPTEVDLFYFDSDYCSIISHYEKEFILLKDFIHKNLRYKIFSPFKFMTKEYCGNIPEQLYYPALVSSKKLIATNILNYMNYKLLNDEVIYPSKVENISRDDILDRHTCFSSLEEIIGQNSLEDIINFDVKELYSKFRNENQV